MCVCPCQCAIEFSNSDYFPTPNVKPMSTEHRCRKMETMRMASSFFLFDSRGRQSIVLKARVIIIFWIHSIRFEDPDIIYRHTYLSSIIHSFSSEIKTRFRLMSEIGADNWTIGPSENQRNLILNNSLFRSTGYNPNRIRPPLSDLEVCHWVNTQENGIVNYNYFIVLYGVSDCISLDLGRFWTLQE